MNALIRSASTIKLAATASLVLVTALGAAGSAHAEVIWSVGVHEPGVNVRVSNAPPPPVVVAQAPVVVTPPVVMQPPPVVVRPAPVVVAQPHVVYPMQPVVYVPEHHHPHGHAWGHRKWREQAYREHERHEHAFGYGRGYDHDRH